MTPLRTLLEQQLRLQNSATALVNFPRVKLVNDALRYREAILTKSGALSVWNPAHASGRIPKDTYTVRHDDDTTVDWSQENNHPLEPGVFDALFEDALHTLRSKERLYVTDRCVGAEMKYSLSVRVITPSAVTSLFADTMFRPCMKSGDKSVFGDKGFTLLVLPHDRISTEKYKNVLREENGQPVPWLIAMDLKRRLGIVYGTSYLGAVKKTMFTTMNGLLPELGVLPLHCSATQDSHKATHLFLGLSGTGKTTLSVDPRRTLIGDDEHLWSEAGVANMENGCYAKLIRLNHQKEPDIYEAVFGIGKSAEGVIIENAMTYPDGSLDLDDTRLTENSRAAFTLETLRGTSKNGTGTHPSTIVFLTADASGVLPPVAKLPPAQAMLWFFLGYTSKLAGTEMGIVEPKATFSRFFGAPFMPCTSDAYLSIFQKKLMYHHVPVYLINTGWTGGAYGTGKRMDIVMTRKIVDAALNGQLEDVRYKEDPLFKILVPQECPGIESSLLDARSTWSDASAYDAAAKKLAGQFAAHFNAKARGSILENLREKCPGL